MLALPTPSAVFYRQSTRGGSGSRSDVCCLWHTRSHRLHQAVQEAVPPSVSYVYLFVGALLLH